jgi:hypothetical protein
VKPSEVPYASLWFRIRSGVIAALLAVTTVHAGQPRSAQIAQRKILAGASSKTAPRTNPSDDRRSAVPGLSQPDAGTKVRIAEAYGKQPLGFEANRGQTDAGVQFVSRGAGYTLFLTSTEAVLALRNAPQQTHASGPSPAKAKEHDEATILTMNLIDGNPAARVSRSDELPGKSHYIIGHDSRSWRTRVPRYAKVEYQNVYPGVNLVYYGNQRQLEYDFIVAPGANPDVIALGFEGAQSLHVGSAGDLVLGTAGGEVRLKTPVIYQEINGGRQEISGHYVMKGRERVGFQVGAYDAARPLVVDPVLVYSTYLGGSESDFATGIAVDRDGSAYVTGHTLSIDFPTSSSIQPGCPTAGFGGCDDAFVTKLSPDGASIVYSTYFGGTADEGSNAIAVDGAGNAYVTGATRSADFPTVNPVQPAFGSGPDYYQDAFVAKFSADGSALMYSTYLGGNTNDFGLGIAIDNEGRAYVTGETDSANFPTVNALQPMLRGPSDAFVANLAPDGSALVYSTYLGSTGYDTGFAIAADAQGDVSVTGRTVNYDGSNYRADGFVTSFGPSGSLLYNRQLTAAIGYGIAIDGGDAYVTGVTAGGLPLVAALQSEFGGQYDAFVAKLDVSGHTVYCSYLGGSGYDRGSAIAVDSTGNIVVVGFTNSADFPTLNPLQEQVRDFDIFITKLDPTGLI